MNNGFKVTTEVAAAAKRQQRILRLLHLFGIILFIILLSTVRNYYNYNSLLKSNGGGTTKKTPSSSLSSVTTKFKNTNNSSSSSSTTTTKTTTFVFFIGLEGTGHHYVGDIIRYSPTLVPALTTAGIYPKHTIALGKSLFQQRIHPPYGQPGLFNAYCSPKEEQQQRERQSSTSRRHHHYSDRNGRNVYDTKNHNQRRTQSTSSSSEINSNIREYQQIVFEELQSIHQLQMEYNSRLQQQQQQQQLQDDIYTLNYYPVNTWVNTHTKGWNGIGQLSYPNMKGNSCRSLNYPQLDLWYDICNQLKEQQVEQGDIDCVHVYLYRNPYSIIKSTTLKRSMNTNIIQAIHLYISQLSILYTQLSRYSNHTIGCWGLFETTNNHNQNENNENDNNNYLQLLKDMFYPQTMSMSEFQTLIQQNISNLPIPISETEQQTLISNSLQPYMNIMLQLHQDVINLCSESMLYKQQ